MTSFLLNQWTLKNTISLNSDETCKNLLAVGNFWGVDANLLHDVDDVLFSSREFENIASMQRVS